MLLLCFKLSPCKVGNTRDTSVMYEKAKFVRLFVFNATAKNDILICSNKHETCLDCHNFWTLSNQTSRYKLK